jgi:starch synthase (maltosyl-transferring)
MSKDRDARDRAGANHRTIDRDMPAGVRNADKKPARKAARVKDRHAHPSWSPTARIAIENVYPEVDCGRFPVKRVVGDPFDVWADIFRDGHDVVAAVLRYRTADESGWREVPMRHFDNDRWTGEFVFERNTRYFYTIEAWTDVFASWRQDTVKKIDAGQNVDIDLIEGREILAAAAETAPRAERESIETAIRAFNRTAEAEERAEILLSEDIRRMMAQWGPREDRSAYERELEVVVDRPAARFAAWYEMFPRSQGTVPGRGATFDDCIARLPAVRDMGFDVVYLVPIHPIGRTNRKGPNNTLHAGPNDPGSPYAIGAAEGGHTAVHPELGTLEDFRRFVRSCHELGMEVALDFAIQCSPDHPWIAEHPDWFVFRPDGTIRHAENPPKKYQDIVNVNFQSADQEGLWNELRDVLLFWAGQGVRIFRVDNPHTKPLPFWEWVIRQVQAAHPDVIFLSEAFTRPKMMRRLAKAGYTQSYTYFTWRNTKNELIEYLTELTQTEMREYFRPNFFANTPDILPPYLQTGGRPAFMTRLVLAATLSGVYGIYNGFELCENAAIPGTEEYANSEKYDYKVWDWDRPGNIKDLIRKVNAIRRDNSAFHEFLNLRFHPSDDDAVLFYGKASADGANRVFVAVNLDPFSKRSANVELPLEQLGFAADEEFEVEELITGTRLRWSGRSQVVELDPATAQAAIFRIAV